MSLSTFGRSDGGATQPSRRCLHGVSNTFLTYGNMVAMVPTQLFNQRVFRSKSGHGANIIGTYRVGYILAHPVSIGFNPFSLN